jgi:acetolactate synthase small subunit
MTNEEMQSTMQFILEQQAQFSVNMDALRESQAHTDETVSRLSTQVEQLTTQVEYIARQQSHINEVVAVIADAQQHTDERLNALIDIVSEGRNGKS